MAEAPETPVVEETADETTEVTTNPGPLDVMIGDLILSVPPRQMKIKQTLKIDEIEIPGRDCTVKQPIGYKDSQITIELEICHEEEPPQWSAGKLITPGQIVKTAQDRFKEIQSYFRPGKGNIQQPMPIVSILTELCEIENVLIQDIDIRDDPEYDYLVCTLSLTEADSIANQLQELAQEATTSEKGEEVVEENLPEELQPPDNYLVDQYNQGKDDASGTEPPESAGDDTG